MCQSRRLSEKLTSVFLINLVTDKGYHHDTLLDKFNGCLYHFPSKTLCTVFQITKAIHTYIFVMPRCFSKLHEY